MKAVAAAVVSVTIGLGLSPGCWAAEMSKPNAAQDDNGRLTLGVDVSRAGSSTVRVRTFVAGLPADAATRVRDGCATVMTGQINYHSTLMKFCSALPPKSASLP
jgi:hypothetical protein